MPTRKKLKWVKSLSGQQKSCAAMIVGWQTVQNMLTVLATAYNQNYDANDPDETKLLSVKRWLLASIIELVPKLNGWGKRLKALGLLSQATTNSKRAISAMLTQVQQLAHWRNCTFHFDDLQVGGKDNAKKPLRPTTLLRCTTG